jgi:hypothetical protein
MVACGTARGKGMATGPDRPGPALFACGNGFLPASIAAGKCLKGQKGKGSQLLSVTRRESRVKKASTIEALAAMVVASTSPMPRYHRLPWWLGGGPSFGLLQWRWKEPTLGEDLDPRAVRSAASW